MRESVIESEGGGVCERVSLKGVRVSISVRGERNVRVNAYQWEERASVRNKNEGEAEI